MHHTLSVCQHLFMLWHLSAVWIKKSSYHVLYTFVSWPMIYYRQQTTSYLVLSLLLPLLTVFTILFYFFLKRKKKQIQLSRCSTHPVKPGTYLWYRGNWAISSFIKDRHRSTLNAQLLHVASGHKILKMHWIFIQYTKIWLKLSRLESKKIWICQMQDFPLHPAHFITFIPVVLHVWE